VDAAGLTAPARRALAASWELCAAEPGTPRPAEGGTWIGCTGPAALASALREAGTWSLDGPPRDWWYVARFVAPPEASGPMLR